MRLLFLSLMISFSGCYSFSGFNIDESLTTFSVIDFKNTTYNSPPTIQQTFSEQLREKISRESRLVRNDENPDIVFSGTVTRFSVTSVAPEANARTAAQRLDIGVSVTFENTRDPEDKWTQTFSHFLDFPSDQDLLSVQDELIEGIFDQVIEDIFNRAFNNW